MTSSRKVTYRFSSGVESMESQNTWPEFGQRETPQGYAEKLRTRVFDTQAEAARYFGVHRATIGGYEKPEYEGGRSTIPPLGYLASLVVLLVERNMGKPASAEEMAAAQEFLLRQINKLLGKHSAAYKYRTSLKDWEELHGEADKYRPKGLEPQEPPPVPRPYLVPDLPPQGVFGRDEALTQIEQMLATRTSTTAHISPVALQGFGGIGKTTLARSIGRKRNVALLYPGGVLWTELGPEPIIRQLLTMWGDALDLDLRPERDEAACEAILRNALAQRKALLIVDDVWNPDHARHFLLGGPNCRSLFTTRDLDVAYDLTTPDRTFKVDFLDLPNSLRMLETLAPKAVALDRKAAARLCAKLDGLPLAIKLAARLLAVEGDVPSRMRRLVDELIERREARLKLIQSEHRPGLPKDEPPSLQAILGMSVERLSSADKGRFAKLAVFGGEPLTWEIGASAAVWKCSIEEAEATMSRLIRRALVERRSDGRYWMHQLLADYAAVLLDQISV
jgi:hypothetical protein